MPSIDLDTLHLAIKDSTIDIHDHHVTITSDHTRIADLNQIHRVIQKITRTKQPLYSLNSQQHLHFTRLGLDFLNLPMHTSRYPLADYHPYIALAKRAYDQFAIDDYRQGHWLDQQPATQASRLNTAIDWIRQEANSPRFKAQRIKHDHRRSKNYRSLKGYLDRLQERYAKLLIIRLDLYFTKALRTQQEVSHRQLDACRKAFLRRIGLNYGQAFVGYAWKLEFGLERNHHFHLLLIFNGNKLQSDERISHGLGKLWSEQITKGSGCYYACNGQKTQYRYCGIGMLEHRDTVKRNHLDLACQYLTKTDYYVHYSLPDGARSFGRGEIDVEVKKRGRKRVEKPS